MALTTPGAQSAGCRRVRPLVTRTGLLGVFLLKFGPSSPGAHARIGLPAALHEVGSRRPSGRCRPGGAPAAGTTQAEGVTICAFLIAIVIEASAGRSGGDLASA